MQRRAKVMNAGKAARRRKLFRTRIVETSAVIAAAFSSLASARLRCILITRSGDSRLHSCLAVTLVHRRKLHHMHFFLDFIFH